jgi:hypothetical protein
MAKSPDNNISRRDFLKVAGLGTVLAGISGIPVPKEFLAQPEASPLTFADGKYQTYPRLHMKSALGDIPVFQNIDVGTLGPDVDTIVGIDFQGDIPTNAEIISRPTGKVEETRVVFIKRTDLETVQLKDALGGDRFDVYKMSEHGGNAALDAMARKHAVNTARKHQKVVFLHDLGLTERDSGNKERQLLNTIILAQRPDRPDLGIQLPDFVNARQY